MGCHGLGNRNEDGELLIDFALSNDLVIGGGSFQYCDIQKYSWTSPDGITRNRIDHCLISRKLCTSLMDVSSQRGVDVGADVLYRLFSNPRSDFCCHLCQKGDAVVEALDTPGQHEELFAFADDTTLGAAAPDESSLILKLQLMTENIYRWFDANLLALNVKKLFLLIFSRIGKSCPTVTELKTSKGSISRPADRFIRFLGILLDENLSFKRHTESMRLKVSRGLGIIPKLKRVFPFSILRLLYFSLIYPYLCYCSSLWMSTFPSVLTPLHNLQLKAAKVLQSTTHIFVELLKIKDIHTLHLSFIAFQYFRGDLPSSFSGLFEIVRNVSAYETRNKGWCASAIHPCSALGLWSDSCCRTCLEFHSCWDSTVLYHRILQETVEEFFNKQS